MVKITNSTNVKITNTTIKNCGTGITANGKVDIEMTGLQMIGNNKDVDLFVEEGSQITIDQLTSLDCKTESITVETYSSKVEGLKEFVASKTDYFSPNEIEEIKGLLEKLVDAKDQPSKTKKILQDVYQVGKSTGSGLLLAYIKQEFGW